MLGFLHMSNIEPRSRACVTVEYQQIVCGWMARKVLSLYLFPLKCIMTIFYEKHKLEGMCECHLLIQKIFIEHLPILYYNVKFRS